MIVIELTIKEGVASKDASRDVTHDIAISSCIKVDAAHAAIPCSLSFSASYGSVFKIEHSKLKGLLLNGPQTLSKLTYLVLLNSWRKNDSNHKARG